MVFRDKIVLSNMKYGIRKKEPEKFKNLLEKHNSDYAGSFIKLSSKSTMEGADIFVMDNNLIYIYQNNRTNPNTAYDIKSRFSDLHIKTIEANIYDIPQHILGGVHIINKNIAARRVEYCSDMIKGIDFIDFQEMEEIKNGLGLNMVTISPSEVLIPMNRPLVKHKLESAGIICHEVKIDEIHKMCGGLVCMVLPLVRE